MYQKKIITSDDGSHTIELIGQNEQYHSTHGAIQESNHVYIKHGLERMASEDKVLHILEVGMGTGLNVLLTWIYAKKHNCPIVYHAIEAFPVEEDIWTQLNYASHLHNNAAKDIYRKIHSSSWGESINLDNNFSFIKYEETIQHTKLPKDYFNVVYFDAFNPDLEPDLWTEKIFEDIYSSMSQDSVLSTYSTKGVVKRALMRCGFKIEKKPGPPGKREILNAIKGLI